MKRRLLIIVPVVAILVALGAVLIMRPAAKVHAAGRGDGWVFQPSGTVELPVGYCAFPVRSDTLADKLYDRTTTQPDGTMVDQFNGTLKVRMTNENTGKYIDLNASGPGEAYSYPDGSVYIVFHGSTFNTFPADVQQASGLPGIAATTGLFSFKIASDGTFAGYTSQGTITDVCAALS